MYHASVYRILVSSPADISADKVHVKDRVRIWNAVHGEAYGINFQVVSFEDDSVPAWGTRPQEELNFQLVDVSDLVFALFWTRLGTPTGAAESGTVEEIERALAQGKPACVWRARRTYPEDVDTDQLTSLRRFLEENRSRALLGSYSTVLDLTNAIDLALTRHAESLQVPVGDSIAAKGIEVRLESIAYDANGSRLVSTQYGLRLRNYGPIAISDIAVSPVDEAASFLTLAPSLAFRKLDPNRSEWLSLPVPPPFDSLPTVEIRWSEPNGTVVRRTLRMRSDGIFVVSTPTDLDAAS